MTKPDSIRISARELLPLSARRNADGLLHSAGHLGAIAMSGTLLWHGLGTGWAVPLTLLHGYFVAFLFSTEHETAHHTAFRTHACNDVMGHLAGFAIALPYEYYRAFHWDHHRFTNDPLRDPELSRALPSTGLGWLWFLTGLPPWADRIRRLLAHGVQGRVDERWVPEDKRPLIVREARLCLLAYGAVVGASIATQSWAALWLWIVPVMVGQPLYLRPYLLAEHTGCARSANMLENTRTTYTHAFVRFFAWNMPYHAEHHAYPSVPFHALPRLNRLLGCHVEHTERGYLAATAAVATHLVSGMRPEKLP